MSSIVGEGVVTYSNPFVTKELGGYRIYIEVSEQQESPLNDAKRIKTVPLSKVAYSTETCANKVCETYKRIFKARFNPSKKVVEVS